MRWRRTFLTLPRTLPTSLPSWPPNPKPRAAVFATESAAARRGGRSATRATTTMMMTTTTTMTRMATAAAAESACKCTARPISNGKASASVPRTASRYRRASPAPPSASRSAVPPPSKSGSGTAASSVRRAPAPSTCPTGRSRRAAPASMPVPVASSRFARVVGASPICTTLARARLSNSEAVPRPVNPTPASGFGSKKTLTHLLALSQDASGDRYILAAPEILYNILLMRQWTF
mmetsp:Transcript_14705/g.42344  ORF Transcript_14705/g.42344 Transcript_14705/m.42344 type:complete len:235 (-) Transcript_14705:166-870(-)